MTSIDQNTTYALRIDKLVNWLVQATKAARIHLHSIFKPTQVDLEYQLAKAARYEAARRATNALIR